MSTGFMGEGLSSRKKKAGPRFSFRMRASSESHHILRTSSGWLFLLLTLFLGLLRTRTAALSYDGMVLLGFKRDVESWTLKFDEFFGGSFLRPRGFLRDWNENDTTPCAWLGVSCTPGSDRVQGLRLSGWSLNYVNLSRLSSLSNLQELDLSSNLIGSTTPHTSYFMILEALSGTQLSWLDLSRNSIGPGEISIGSNTRCSGPRNLRFLSLEGNVLTGSMPSLGCFPDLQQLSVAGNQLNGSIPRQLFQNSSKLVSVDLSWNNFTGDIHDLRGLTRLRNLDLSHNQLTEFGTSDDEFLSLKNLRWLHLSRNRLRGSIPSGIANMDSIEILDLSDNQLSGEIPRGIRRNSTTILNLSTNMLSGTIPSDLLDIGDELDGLLLTVNLSRNFLVGEVPEPRSSYGGPGIFALDLSYNTLEGTFPAHFWSCIMWLQHTQLGGNVSDLFLANSFWMMELRVEGAAFHGELDMTILLKRGAGLHVMDLSNTKVIIRSTLDYPNPLQTMLNFLPLRELRLSGTDLRELRLAGTNLSGETWLNTTFLQVLDLSNSSLGGPLPDELFNGSYLPALKLLNLSSNGLQGRVPPSIAQLARTIVLDLSNNPGLCGDPLPPCSSGSQVKLWVLLSATHSICLHFTD